jgi:hypothetical protein
MAIPRCGVSLCEFWVFGKQQDRSVMSYRVSVVPLRLLAVLAAFVLLAVASVASAQAADPFGELQNFGEGEITTPEKAMGIDPETGNVYVVDQNAGTFKILDFSVSEGKSIASAAFTPKAVTGQHDSIEGVAIDPSMHRLYVLALVTRREEPDLTPAASALYAFSTVPNGKTLEPAEGTEKTGSEKAILVNQATLQPTSKAFGVSLLEPTGIAVDPMTHDVVIAATIDRGKLSKVEEEEGEVIEEYVREATVAVQRIHSDGELGARYIDTRTTELEECEALCINSPVVTSTGHVYAATGEGDELEEFPVPASALVPPATVPVTPTPKVKFNPGCEMECRFGSKLEPEFLEKLTEIPVEAFGSNLTISPEGTLWARARVQFQLTEPAFDYGGALEFSSAFAEEGWTGGQSPASAAGKCVIDDLAEAPAFAAGKEGTLFVLDRSPKGGEEAKGPRIIEFGPNGSGCPHGAATLSAEVGGVEVAEGEPVPIVDSVALSSKLTQANALSVEWEFGDGTPTQTVSTREQQVTKIQHVFTKTGSLTIKEKIYTDNLATPTIEKQEKIDIVGAPKVVTGEAVQIEGTSATLTGNVDPHEQKTTVCEFEYGTTEAYSSGKVPCTPVAGFKESKEVTAKVSGLAKHTLYHFRLVAASGSGEVKGGDRTFTTEAKPPVTEAASSVGANGATLHATVNPEGVATDCKFQYGTTLAYGSQVSCGSSPGSGSSPVAVTASLTGLNPSATYHFRIVAESAGVSSYGADKTLTTERSKQEIEAEEAKRREEEAAVQRHQEEEAAAVSAKKHQEEEAVAAAAAAAKKHQEEEAAATNKRHEEEAKAKVKPLTRAQLLTKALKACKKGPKKKRAKCEAVARKKYGPKAKGKKK